MVSRIRLLILPIQIHNRNRSIEASGSHVLVLKSQAVSKSIDAQSTCFDSDILEKHIDDNAFLFTSGNNNILYVQMHPPDNLIVLA